MAGSGNQALNSGLIPAVVTRAFQKNSTIGHIGSESTGQSADNGCERRWVLRPRHTVKASTWSEQAARIPRLANAC